MQEKKLAKLISTLPDGPACGEDFSYLVKIGKEDVVKVASRTVHNLVLDDMTPKVVELVVFHIEPLKQPLGL